MALSASTDGTLRLWEVSSGQELAHWRIDGELYCCALGFVAPASLPASGLLVVAGDQFGGVHILDVVGVVVAAGSQSRQDAGGTDAAEADQRGVPVAMGQPAKRRGIWPFQRRGRL